jgi:type I restriction-modification system DNA methylase subunit
MVKTFVGRLRAFDRFTAGRRLASLTSLRVLAGGSSEAVALLDEFRNLTVHYGDSGRVGDTLYKISNFVEDMHPELSGVFTSALIPDVLQTGGSLPELSSLAADIAMAFPVASPEGIGAWFDAVLDEISHGPNTGEVTTPKSIARLMALLVSPSPGALVLDPSCGLGATLVAMASLSPGAQLHGQDSSGLAAALSRLRLYLLGLNGEIVVADSLRAPARWRNGAQRFDAIICDPPVGMAMISASDPAFKQRFGHMRTQRHEALFIEHCVQHLCSSGRAVLLVQSGFLSRRGGEAHYRGSLLSRGLVEGIISLPSGVIPWTELPFSLVILRGAGEPDSPVVMVDAAYLRRASRRSVERLNNDAVDEIFELYQGLLTSQFSGKVATAAILASGADIQPRRWLIADQTTEPNLSDLYARARIAESEVADARERLDILMADFELAP